jgi:phosphohistidine phosphatase
MIKLLLIRHGIAEDPKHGKKDAERALTAEGWEKTRAAMAGLVRRGYGPTRGFSSPYRRAAETLVCLKECTQSGFPTGYWDGLVPEGSPEAADTWLRGQIAEMGESETLAVVSHQPFLGDLVHHLTGRLIDVKKASCTVLHWNGADFEFAAHFLPSELRGE